MKGHNYNIKQYFEIKIMNVSYFVICFSMLGVIESAKILVVVPTPSISHQVVFQPLILELIRLNHEVTTITADPIYPQIESAKNLKEIDLHDLSYEIWNKLVSALKTDDSNYILDTMTIVFRALSDIFIEQLKDVSVQKLITDTTLKFDLLIVEACVNPALIFSHIFKAPVISMSSFGAVPGNMEMIGSAIHPFLYPIHYQQKFYNLTIWDKIFQLHLHIAFGKMLEKQENNDNIMLQRMFGSDTPPLSQLKNNVHMLFLNVHPVWIHSQPVPYNVIFTWGIHKKPEKLLPKDLQVYLDSSKNGVIYISFGTNVKSSTFSYEKLKIFLTVFSQLPYDILWKWDLDELPGRSENIRIYKWLPQSDLLRHPNLKLFITQGGLQSTEEAINAAVPLIGIPMFADQGYNTEKYVHFKIGIQLNLKSLNEDNFKNAIETILDNHESYRNNIIKLRTQMYDQPKPPLENAVWWIEYVIRHGGAGHLRTPAANIYLHEYYELKLVCVLFGGLILIVALFLLSIYACYKCTSVIKKNLQINKTKKS